MLIFTSKQLEQIAEKYYDAHNTPEYFVTDQVSHYYHGAGNEYSLDLRFWVDYVDILPRWLPWYLGNHSATRISRVLKYIKAWFLVRQNKKALQVYGLSDEVFGIVIAKDDDYGSLYDAMDDEWVPFQEDDDCFLCGNGGCISC